MTRESTTALMRDDAPTWSSDSATVSLRVDVSSTATSRNTQIWLLAAGVLFGISGSVIATWLTNWGQGGGGPPKIEAAITAVAATEPAPAEPPPPAPKPAPVRDRSGLGLVALAAVVTLVVIRRRRRGQSL
jgi:hypothetical protein